MRMGSFKSLAACLISAPLTLALLAGCESQDKPRAARQEFFARENDPRMARQTAQHQAMLGAQADPTLYRCHFDGNSLNDLGKTKLDLLLTNGAPAKIYVDGGRDATEGYRAAVNSYLSAAKVQEGSVAVESGVAPESISSAAQAIGRMTKTESPQTTSSSNETSADNSGMSTTK